MNMQKIKNFVKNHKYELVVNGAVLIGGSVVGGVIVNRHFKRRRITLTTYVDTTSIAELGPIGEKIIKEGLKTAEDVVNCMVIL